MHYSFSDIELLIREVQARLQEILFENTTNLQAHYNQDFFNVQGKNIIWKYN